MKANKKTLEGGSEGEPAEHKTVSLKNWMSSFIFLGQIKQVEWAQDSSYDYNLFFLSFVNLATLEQLGWNNTQLLYFAIEIVSTGMWAQYQANICTGNNAWGFIHSSVTLFETK